MKPVQLTIKGFTSFRQETVIDFKGLELFAIVGPTGSGKSSLLDAISFVLYGRTPRLGTKELVELISQGESQLKVSLIFEINNQLYRVTRVKTLKKSNVWLESAYIDDSGEQKWENAQGHKLKDLNNEIIQLIGLDFNSFIKAILLPQGEFSKILHGNSSERKELLGALIDIKRIEKMQKFASERAKAFYSKKEEISRYLDSEYEDINSEKIAQLSQQIESIHSFITELEKKEVILQQELHELTRQEQLDDQLQQQLRRKEILLMRKSEIDSNRDRAIQAKKVASILILLHRYEEALLSYERDQEELRNIEKELNQKKEALDSLSESKLTIGHHEERIQTLEQEREHLYRSQHLFQQFKQVGAHGDIKHDNPLEWNIDLFYQAKEEHEKQNKQQRLKEKLEAEKLSIEEVERNIYQLQEERQSYYDLRDQIEEEGKQKTQEIEELSKELEHYKKLQEVSVYRSTLQIDEPCPLCCQPVKEIPETSNHQLKEYEDTLNALKEERTSLREKYLELKNSINYHTKLLSEKESELEKRKKQITEEQLNLEKITFTMNDPQLIMTRLLADLVLKIKELGDDPEKQIKSLSKSIKESQELINKIHTSWNQANHEWQTAKTVYDIKQSTQEKRKIELDQSQADLYSQLQFHDLELDQIKKNALDPQDIEAFQEAAQKYYAQLSTIEETIQGIQSQIGELFTRDKLLEVKNQTVSLQQELSNYRQDIARMKAEKEYSLQKLSSKEKRESELLDYAYQYDRWHKLQKTLQSDQFQKFMLAEIEYNLLRAASELLYTMSQERYKLILNDYYQIQDFWNAGEIRHIKTLSGGETFLASLALAVALSDYLAGTRQLGSLFLDEGFGTLDPQALEAVSSALENLQTQGRMIGVVTHVEALSQRLPHRLIVSKKTNGSIVQHEVK